MDSLPQLARRVRALKPSVTIAVSNRAKEMKRQGKDVLSFTLGEPDFDTPQRIKDAAIAALNAGQTKYMPTLGDPETRAVIARKLREENNIPGIEPDHIAIGAGGKHVLFTLMHCLLDPPHGSPDQDKDRDQDQTQDEVLIPVPGWVSYAPIAELAGGKVIELETTVEHDFKISTEQLRAAITPRSKVLVLNSPSNPCATMYSEAELRAIAEVVHEAASTTAPNLVVLTDEIYEKIVYGDTPHFSIGSVPEIADRVITLNGLSKAFAMTGWRIGYCGIPGPFGAKLIKAMAALQSQMTTSITSFNYPAIRVALTECPDDIERMRRAFAKRAEVIIDRLAQVPDLTTATPTGAFYAFPNVSAYFGRTSPSGRSINSALDLCEAALEEAGLAMIPGEDFGGVGREHVRISFACSEQQIHAGIDRLARLLASLT